MSTKINEIVQQKARETAGTLKTRNHLPPPLQMMDRGFAFRGSDEAKRNVTIFITRFSFFLEMANTIAGKKSMSDYWFLIAFQNNR